MVSHVDSKKEKVKIIEKYWKLEDWLSEDGGNKERLVKKVKV